MEVEVLEVKREAGEALLVRSCVNNFETVFGREGKKLKLISKVNYGGGSSSVPKSYFRAMRETAGEIIFGKRNS